MQQISLNFVDVPKVHILVYPLMDNDLFLVYQYTNSMAEQDRDHPWTKTFFFQLLHIPHLERARFLPIYN